MRLVAVVAVACALLRPTAGRSARHRKAMGENKNTIQLSVDDPMFSKIATALPDVENVAVDGSEEMRMAEPAPMPFEDLTQVSSCPSPDAATVVRRTQQIANRTDWHAFPNPTNGLIWLSWARDSQEELLVTITRPVNGDNQRSVWLSTDAGGSFDPITLPSGFPSGLTYNLHISKCFYGNANTMGSFNAYCTLTQPHGVFGITQPQYVGFLFSSDAGRTWSVKTTTLSSSPVPIDVIDVHPYFPGALLLHRTIDASNNLYRTYFGQVTPSGSIAVMQLTPNATYTINGNRVQQQILAMWAGWSTGGTNANNTIFIMAQESHAIAPNNGMSIRKATINWGSTSTVSYSRNPVPNLNDVSDFTQINNFFIAEITSAHQGTNGGFNETSMLLSSDGVTFSAAQVAVGPTELVESFEVVQASAGQVTLAAQHSTARLQGEVAVTVNIARGPAINLNASRAIFSDIIPATPAPGQPAFIFDPTNPWGCNSSFNIASQVATAAANNAAGYYLVVRRGNYPNGSLCYFASKLDNAISAGAQGLIIVNNQPSTGRPNLYMVAPEGADTSDFGTVPCLMVSRTEGEWLIGNLTNAQRTAPTQTSVGQVIESNTAAQKLWQYTALYISDGTGYFSRSLKNVLYVVNNNVEYVGLYAVQSMSVDPAFSSIHGTGTFLANTQSGGTLISTNKGATWTHCTVAGTSNPLLIVLDALSAQHGWSGPKSVFSAPGLIVANAAASTSRRNISPTAYVSRDGGLSWMRANPNNINTADDDSTLAPPVPYMFDILDHGSVIVLVETTTHTSLIYYSLDEGITWAQFAFYGSTTFLGRWHNNANGNTFDCFPVYSNNRTSETPPTPGFLLYCLGKTWSSARYTSFTVNVPGDPTGFSGSSDGVMATNPAVVLSATANISSTYPPGHGVSLVNGTFVVNGQTLVRPGRDPTHPNAHHIRFFATLTNFRASATQIFAYWYQRTPVGNSVIGLRFDFSGVLPAACTAASYEQYQLAGANGTCYLGQSATVQRRRQCVTCRQSSAVAAMSTDAAWQHWHACDCRGQDYACAFGYRRVNNVLGSSRASTAEACTFDTTVTSVTASDIWYRKVPGDECLGQIGHAQVVPSPSNGGSGGGSAGGMGTVVGIVIVAVLILIVGGFAYQKGMCGGRKTPRRYMEIRADDTLATAEDAESPRDNDDDDDDADDDLLDATVA